MVSLYRFIVEPLDGKYRTSKKVGDKTLYLTSSIEDAKYVSRMAVVFSVPLNYRGNIKKGDTVVIHHNIFRDYYNHNGKVSTSNDFIEYEGRGMFMVNPDLIYLYKSSSEWESNDDFCFVRPISEINDFTKTEKLVELKGEIVYSNQFSKGDVVGFTPHSEYEFTIDNEVLYRMRNSDICFLYEGSK